MPWPKSLDDGVSFSSNPGKSYYEIFWWFDRWDAVVQDGNLHILIYWRNPKYPGFDDGAKFFPPALKKQLKK